MFTTLRPGLAAIILIFAAGLALPAHGQRANVDYVSDGLTRDTLELAAQPTPAPAPAAHVRSRSAAEPTAQPEKVKVTASHQKSPRHLAASAPASRPARKTAIDAHRYQGNPVARFVYWWNGWVLRTFNTKFGTVLLKTVGAKQTVSDA